MFMKTIRPSHLLVRLYTSFAWTPLYCRSLQAFPYLQPLQGKHRSKGRHQATVQAASGNKFQEDFSCQAGLGL